MTSTNNQVTPTPGPVVVPDVPPIPEQQVIQFWNGKYWLCLTLGTSDPEAYAKGRPYRIVHIPGEGGTHES